MKQICNAGQVCHATYPASEPHRLARLVAHTVSAAILPSDWIVQLARRLPGPHNFAKIRVGMPKMSTSYCPLRRGVTSAGYVMSSPAPGENIAEFFSAAISVRDAGTVKTHVHYVTSRFCYSVAGIGVTESLHSRHNEA